MTQSVWAEHPLPAFPPLEGDLKTDVLVIGGGLAGVLCAWKLTQAGVDCALIEADRICHGVTRNTTAKLTSQHGLIYDRLIRSFDVDTARLYWQANERALEEYRLLARSIDCDLETKDHYVYTLNAPQKLERELAALERMGVPAEFRADLPLPFGTAGAVRFPEQAQFHPLKLVSGLAGGLKIFEGTAAREFVGKTVTTDRGRITADKVIVATHFPINNKHGGYFLKMYQQRSYVLALENGPDVDGITPSISNFN